ncbi:MAG: hypothetical protein ACRYG8_10250 [Janthinobacterium lividum]
MLRTVIFGQLDQLSLVQVRVLMKDAEPMDLSLGRGAVGEGGHNALYQRLVRPSEANVVALRIGQPRYLPRRWPLRLQSSLDFDDNGGRIGQVRPGLRICEQRH